MTQLPVNLMEYEPLAREKLSQMVFEYYAGGADDEVTLRENMAAYQRLFLRPHMLRGVGNRTSDITLLNQSMRAPLLIAPMAFMKMAHEEGEAAVARAAAARGLTMVVSTSATMSVQDVAASAPDGNRWFQLYVETDRSHTVELISIAEEAGYTGLVVTIDRPQLGRREADIRNNFRLPSHLKMGNLNVASWEAYRLTELDDNLTWDDVDWLCSITRLPVLLKGILRGDDAQNAYDHGAAAVIVSNHGGRQLDSVQAPIDALPKIASAVGGKLPILMDGGIRRGTDLVKALARGAQAVLLGRPVLWGLAHDGEAGVGHVLDLLLAEFDLALALCGCRSPQEITPDLVVERR
ncbi:MAG: alpha-hydroxy acid oxidase [Anaerolineae bacterium]